MIVNSTVEPTGTSPSKCTNLFWRVRPLITLGSFFDGPSTSAASVRPTACEMFRVPVAFHDLGQAIHALPCHRFGHEIVDHLGRGGARPRREDEDVCRVVLRDLRERHRGGKVGFGLTRESHDDVARDRQVRNGRPRHRQLLQVPLGGIAAPHLRQRPVAPRLHREVEVLTHGVALRHRRDRLGPQVFRVGGGEANPIDTVDRVDRAQEIGELWTPLPGAQVAAVRVHVLAQQRDLGDAVAREFAHLVDDVAHPAADLRAPDRRNDAERATVVAADLNREPRAVIDLTLGRERRRIRLVLFEDLDDRLTSACRFGQQCRRVGQIVGAEDDVDVTGALHDQVPVLLSQAPADRDLQIRSPFLQLLEATEMPVQLVVGVLPDTAGVEHHDIRRLEIVGGNQPIGRENPGDPLGIVLVHLTPEGTNVEAPGHAVILRPGSTRPSVRISRALLCCRSMRSLPDGTR